MRLITIRYLFLIFILFIFSRDAFAQSGSSSEVEITESDIIIFCKGHEAGDIKEAREHGVELFGSYQNFYNNYHRIQCPPHFPSPLYMSISKAPFEHQIDKEIEFISRLSEDKRHKVLNRPSKGFFKQTVLEIVQSDLERAKEKEKSKAIERYQNLVTWLREAGAKASDELTEEEKEQLGVER